MLETDTTVQQTQQHNGRLNGTVAGTTTQPTKQRHNIATDTKQYLNTYSNTTMGKVVKSNKTLTKEENTRLH